MWSLEVYGHVFMVAFLLSSLAENVIGLNVEVVLVGWMIGKCYRREFERTINSEGLRV